MFGRPFGVTQANLVGGIAAAAVLAMGEGAERAPLCLLSDLLHVSFQTRNPTAEELHEINTIMEVDLFAPFLSSVAWQAGQNRRPRAKATY